MTPLRTYPPGVPCWVETLQPDPRAALDFYRGVFGWAATGPGRMPGGGEYFVAQIDGDDVAGIAALPPDSVPAWSTQIRVDDATAAAERVVRAGGSVLAGPFEAAPAGRGAVLRDPCGGALFRLAGYVGGLPEQPVPRDVVATMFANDAQPPYWGVDFWIDDADAAAARAERLGGTIVAPPHDTPLFRQAVVADCAGATFSISQLLGAPAARRREP